MRRRLLALAAVLLAVPLAGLINGSPPPASDYERELAQVQSALADLSRRPEGSGIEGPFAHLLYRRAALTGHPADVRAAEAGIARALRGIGPAEDVLLVKATLDLRLHRLPEALRGLQMLPSRDDRAAVRLLRADVALQEGRDEEARRQYTEVAERSGRWDALARLADLESRVGDPEQADRLYARAEDELSAKEMRAYAWVRVQRGWLRFRRGQHEEAMAHYRRAEQAYSGYWLVEEHVAELLGAQGKLDDALALYRRLAARAPRPELYQALGDLYRFAGRPQDAGPWHDRALALYLESAGRGEPQYYHHLATFYADVRGDGAEAVKWARRDAALRPNAATRETLAWALYRDGRYAEALTVVEEALGSGVTDAHLCVHAAMIHLAAGKPAEGRAWLARAAAINPRYASFHVHR